MRRHAIARAIAGARWNPRDGLIGSDQGLWLDPSDLSTMFVESGASPGTLTPASLNGLVGRILDKSGRGNHAFAPTDAARPTLKQDANGRYYLLFNGSTSMQTASINFTATDKMFVSAGVRSLANDFSIIAELSAIADVGSFTLSRSAGGGYFFRSKGSTAGASANVAGPVAPISNVITGIGAIGTDVSILRVNGAQAATSAEDQGTGNFGNYPLYIGARAGTSLFFNGHLYQLVICGRPTAVPFDQITRTEEFVNRKTKAY